MRANPAPPRTRRLATVVALALAAAGCTGGDAPPPAPSPPQPTAATETPTAPSTATPTPTAGATQTGLTRDEVMAAGADTAEKTGDPRAPSVTVTEVRVGAHDGFDRIVFEIGGSGGAGWIVHYADEARAQGSGELVDVAGDAVLVIALSNIALPMDAPEGAQPWDGPERIPAPGDGPLVELVDDTIFEGMHTFFAGVSARAPFQVRRFGDPQRIVVDIADP